MKFTKIKNNIINNIKSDSMYIAAEYLLGKAKSFIKKNNNNTSSLCFALSALILLNNFPFMAFGQGNENKSNFDCNTLSTVSEANIEELKGLPYSMSDRSIRETISLMTLPFKVKESEKVEVTNEEKIEVILNRYNITREQLQTIIAVFTWEAGPTREKTEENEKYNQDRYQEGLNVTGTLINRICRHANIRDVENYFGEGNGTNIYYQVIYPNAYTPYQNGQYLNFLDATAETEVVFQAVIDCLYDPDPHIYLGFKGDGFQKDGYVQLVDNGNWYFYEMNADELAVREEFIASIKEENKQFEETLKNGRHLKKTT